MSGMNLLYPRLDTTSARRLLANRADCTLTELEPLAALHHPDAEPSATGGHPVPPAKLQQLQIVIREAAVQAGYPRPLTRSTQAFDRPCGTALLKEMDIVPADAAEDGVWSFLTLVLVPEIGPWRFPRQPEERLLGRPRNVLRRLWWRARTLGPDLDNAPEGCEPLGEDEFVQIMERPSLGGNTRTARSLQEALWRAERTGIKVPRSELMRQMARRLRATRSHLSLDAITDEQLLEVLDRIARESHEHLVR